VLTWLRDIFRRKEENRQTDTDELSPRIPQVSAIAYQVALPMWSDPAWQRIREAHASRDRAKKEETVSG